MRCDLAVLADYANQTGDGKLNIMGIFDQIRAQSVPAVHASMSLICVLKTDPTDRGATKDVEISLLDADGRELMKLSTQLQIAADAPLSASMPQVLNLNGVRLERFGDYSFYLTVNGEPKATIPFSLVQMPAPAAGPAVPPA